MNNYFSKINKIEKLLKNEEMLNHYISEIENNNLITSDINLSQNIINNINKKDNTFKLKVTNFLKVCGFTMITLLLWNVFTFTNLSENINVKINSENKAKVYESVNDFTSKFSHFLLVPINFKGGENV